MEGTPSDLARIVSAVVVGVVGTYAVTKALKSLGPKARPLGVLTGVAVVVLHEEFDAPLARLLSKLGL